MRAQVVKTTMQDGRQHEQEIEMNYADHLEAYMTSLSRKNRGCKTKISRRNYARKLGAYFMTANGEHKTARALKAMSKRKR